MQNTDMDTHTNVVYICKTEMIGFDANVPFFNLLVQQILNGHKKLNGKKIGEGDT